MRTLLTFWALVALSLAGWADEKKSEEFKGDLKLMQGDWQVTSIERDGVRLSGDEVKSATMKITGDKFVFESPLDGTQEGSLKLDESKKPKHLDVTIASGDKVLAIYEITGDEMKVCYTGPGGDRPTEFTGKVDSGCSLIVMKRKK